MEKVNFVIFEELEKKFIELGDNYMEGIVQIREQCSSQTVSSGIMFNVYPFEAQRHGWKVNGKKIPKVVMKDNCYVYYFDINNKIRLVENASEFLGKIYNFTLYDYVGNEIFSYICNSNRMISVSLARFVNGICTEKYFVGCQSWHYEKYFYENGRLLYIDIFQIKNKKAELREKHVFYYDDKGKLTLIQRRYLNGYFENLFANKRLEYKKIKKRLESDLENIINSFVCGHEGTGMSAIGLRLWIDDINPIIQVNFETEKNIPEIVGDWKFSDFGTIDIADVPLDERQQKKIRGIILEVLVKLIKDGVLHCKVKMVENDDLEIIENSNELKEYLKGVECYFI